MQAHGILQARILEWVAFHFSRKIFPTQESTRGLLHFRQILYQLSHQGSPRILEWVAFPFSRGIFPTQGLNTGLPYCCNERWGTCILSNSCIVIVKVKLTQSRLTLYPMECTLHGILQARILEWVGYPFSSGSSRPRNQPGVSCISGRFFTR